MAVFITGDTHRDNDVGKLNSRRFKRYMKHLTKDDYLIIAGDFGFVWFGNKKDDWWLNWLNDFPCTVLFVEGNHENHFRLSQYPVEDWNSGKIHKIRDSVFHLMRGQVYEIDGKKFYTMGGARSHDKWHRRTGISWWPEEMPSKEEYEEALKNLEANNWKVDYVVTHCAPARLLQRLGRHMTPDELTEFHQKVADKLEFERWYFGHYHQDREFLAEPYTCLYNLIEQIF